MARFVDPVLQGPYSISVQCFSHELKLSLAVASSQHEDLTKRFDNLSSILNFLFNNFLRHLPSEEAAQFKRSLIKSVVNNALNHLLVPSLPSSFGLLPSFLKVLKRAVAFEEDDISGLLGKEWSIKSWSDGVAGHYERRRRIDILEKARVEILAPDDVQDVFTTTTDEGPEITFPTATSARSDSSEIDAWGLDEPPSNVPEENMWNLDDRLEPDAVDDDTGGWAFDESIKEADTWGLDEEMAALPNDSAEIGPQGGKDPDSWGWNDDKQADEMIEDNAWDDPWTTEAVEIEPPTSEGVAINSPKAGTRLEKKLASKRKQNGHAFPWNLHLS
jgi:centromere/kinetochore protein ZW10